MALVFSKRKTMPDEKGDVLVDILINRAKPICCYLLLDARGDDWYEVVGGGHYATELFSLNSTVLLKQIERADYSHMVTQRE